MFQQYIVKRILIFLLSTVAMAGVCAAQQGMGNITGRVYDQEGKVISNSNVEIKNTLTGTIFQTITNGSGLFNSPSLISGPYDVAATAKGFGRAVVKDVIVQVGNTNQVDLTLAVGSASATVTVTAQSPALNTTSGTNGVVVDEVTVHDLPLNGRSALALATLTPGVITVQGPVVEGLGDRGQALSQMMINGSPNSSNGSVLDGQNNVQGTTTGEIAINPTADAVKEFTIQSGVMSAEYGYTLGGVVSIVTRSGTDQYHGSLYEFLRNDALDARNYFAAEGKPKPKFRYDQYGGTLGGKVPRVPVFLFGNLEHYYYLKQVPAYASVPTAAQRGGDYSSLFAANGTLIPVYDPATTAVNPSGNGYVRDKFPDNKIPVGRLDPAAVAIQNAFYPLPNNVSGPYNPVTQSNNFLGASPTILYMTQYFVRADSNLTDRDSIFGRFAHYDFQTGLASLLLVPGSTSRKDHNINRSLTLGYIHIFSPSLINDVRLSAIRNTFTFRAGTYGEDWPSKLGLPDSVPSDTVPVVGNGLPAFNATIGSRSYTNPQLTDILTKTLGRHTLKFGTDLRINEGGNTQENYPSGTFSFSSTLTGNPQSQSGTGNLYASFLLGQVSSASIATIVPTLDRQKALAFFVQDDARLTHSLTVNVGLRYEYQQIPYEQNNKYSNFNPFIKNPLNGLLGAMTYAGDPGIGRNFQEENYLDFSPRVGFAWSFTSDGKSVLRGGYGIYHPQEYNTLYTGDTTGYSNTTSYASANTNFAAFQFSQGLPSPPVQPIGRGLGPSAFLGSGVAYTSPSAVSPMSQQWNLAIGRELPGRTVVQIAYAGNRGTHLVQNTFPLNHLPSSAYALGTALQNQVPNPYFGIVPSTTSLGKATISRAQSLLPYPYYTTIGVRFPHTGSMTAHFLEITAQRQAEKNLSILFSYTAGKIIDVPIESSGTGSGSIAQDPENLRAERSLDTYDIAQRGSLAVLYNLPFGMGQHFSTSRRWVDQVIGGWKVNTIGVIQGGKPLAISGANNNLATRPNFVPGTSAKLDHPTRQKWFNTAAFINPPSYTYGNVPRTLPNVRSPKAVNIDLSLFKDFHIHDRARLQFRAESFNVFNHPNFSSPNTSFSPGSNGLNASGTFGVISSTTTDNRDIQLALKFMF